MGEAKRALETIVRIRGGTDEQARAFCNQVQASCLSLPSFATIAKAVEKLESSHSTIREVAERASALQGWGIENLVTQVETAPAPPDTSPILDSVHQVASTQLASFSLVESVARHVLDELAPGSIAGKVIGFTGNRPYLQTDLERLATKLGATPDREGIAWTDLRWVVIGRDEFDEVYLRNAAQVEGILYLSQEDFLGRILFGESPALESFEARRHQKHPGFKFLASLQTEIPTTSPTVNGVLANSPVIKSAVLPTTPSAKPPLAPATPQKPPTHAPTVAKPPVAPATPPKAVAPAPAVPPKPSVSTPRPFATTRPNSTLPSGWHGFSSRPRSTPAPPAPSNFKWPDPYSFSDHEGHADENLNLQPESDLKKLGYSVAKGISVSRRQKVLDSAVRDLGLKRVADHLAWSIRFYRKNPKFHDAVLNWEQDFKWLRSRY